MNRSEDYEETKMCIHLTSTRSRPSENLLVRRQNSELPNGLLQQYMKQLPAYSQDDCENADQETNECMLRNSNIDLV
jgi:hypothetical protein